MNRIRSMAFAAGIAILAVWCPTAARAQGGYSLFVVPARYSVMQVMFDVMRRAPVALVSYQTAPEMAQPLLHVWNGREWIKIAPEDYASGAFMQNRPARTVLVGEADLLPPELAGGAREWCSNVMVVTELDSASLVNAAGQVLRFSRSDWEWFARKYRMQLEDLNAERRQDSWYYHTQSHLPKREQYAQPGDTMRDLPPAPMAPVAVAPVTVPAPAVEPEPAPEPMPPDAPALTPEEAPVPPELPAPAE